MACNDEHIFVANCNSGLEKLTATEVIHGGGKVENTDPGLVRWKGTLESGYYMCLWSRYSTKILMVLHTFFLENNDDIYTEAKNFDWEVHLEPEKTFSISATLGKNAVVTHSHYALLKLKDGLVDSFKERKGIRPDVKKERADVRFHLHIEGNKGYIYLDFSGESLHRRGYRVKKGEAPIKENIAAALVSFSGWHDRLSSEYTFIDPMCGAGTLLIEAAMIWGKTAPGLSRKYFGFTGWKGHNPEIWDKIVDEAMKREALAYEKMWPKIVGYDASAEMVAIARENIKKAGFDEKIEVVQQDIAFQKRIGKQGVLAVNLPYGERLSDKGELQFLYQGFSRIINNKLYGWRAGVLIAEPGLTDLFLFSDKQSVRLKNGPLDCRLLTGVVEKKEEKNWYYNEIETSTLEDGIDFYNRLVKNLKKIKKWITKNNIHCFRAYDRDLPEYNFAIDVYERHVLLQEYARPKAIDETLAQKRLSVALYIIRKVFDLSREKVFVRKRKRQRGKSQYQKKETQPKFHVVQEGKACFYVNFTNYIDTGLFLDHRPLREMLGEKSRGKRFLNLFSYTASASVHAALGGAVSTTSVDLSATYTRWAKNNFLLNGLSLDNHIFVQQDCKKWLDMEQGIYDIIFIDPPTFSNTKKKGLLFDVQKNHFRLITMAARILDDSGCIYFSTNYKNFTLDERLTQLFSVKNITSETIPYDFRRKSHIHTCWKIEGKKVK